MDERSLRVLEFDKLLALISEHASSDAGRALCLKIRPSKNLRYILSLQKNTSDARRLIASRGRAPSFGGMHDPDAILKRLSAGAPLSIGELLEIKRILDIAGSVRKYGQSEEENSLTEIFLLLDPLTSEAREIDSAIIDEYTVADDASPELSRARRRIKKAIDDIHSSMAQRLNSSREYLSDDVITQRDGRYCLPVRAESKAMVPGIVHGSSQTGLTLFIEPMSIVNLNNELIALKGEEQREIERVLLGLSMALIPNIDAIREDFKLLGRLDMIFAKASYADETESAEPEFSKDQSIDLRGARHPFIPADEVVPIDIRLGGDFTTLVVTGPNTGGKTVSLKTLGLITLMALSGLHIPAQEGSVVGVYDNVYADIGDEQSIEQSLSTFSSHMTTLSRILKEADETSLCLFDELGSGTDPAEGAALGMAILDFLHEKGIHTMATTHYAEIKIYAMTTKGVENASAEFDVETLSPTYRLLIGIPGQSNAFLISKRLGLSGSIIEDARRRLSEENRDLEEIIRDLNEQKSEAARLRAEAETLRAEAKKLRDQAREREKKLRESRDKEIEAARKEARRILKNAKATADSAIAGIRRQDQSLSEAEKQRDKLRDAISSIPAGETLSTKGPSRPVSPSRLKIGDRVSVSTLGGTIGEVVALPDKNNNIQVRIGALLSRVSVSQVEYPKEE